MPSRELGAAVPSPASPSFPCPLSPKHIGTSTTGLRSPPTVTRGGSRPASVHSGRTTPGSKGQPQPCSRRPRWLSSGHAEPNPAHHGPHRAQHTGSDAEPVPVRRQRVPVTQQHRLPQRTGRRKAEGPVTARRAFLQSAPATHPGSSPTTTPGFGGHLARA